MCHQEHTVITKEVDKESTVLPPKDFSASRLSCWCIKPHSFRSNKSAQKQDVDAFTIFCDLSGFTVNLCRTLKESELYGGKCAAET